MASQTVQCTLGVDGGGAFSWAGPNNVTVDDGTMVTAAKALSVSGHSLVNVLLGSFVGFSIPGVAVLEGFIFTSRRLAGGFDAFDDTVSLAISGAPVGANKADAAQWSIAIENTSYGGSSDLWAAGITVTDLNAGLVGIYYQPVNDSDFDNDFSLNGWFLTAYYEISTSALVCSTDA